MTASTKLVESEGKLSGLRAYSASRPQHSEGMAIWMASYLANETNCVNINLLHLTSCKALDAALKMQKIFPHISFKREVTLGHLLLGVDSPGGLFAKVNPPIRPREDVEALWESLIAGDIDWVVSDHACCSHEQKIDASAPKNIFAAKSGFGGTEYLLTGLISEGKKRGLSMSKIAQLLSLNPSRRYGLPTKGDIAVGFDADIVLVDTDNFYVVQAKKSFSSAGYSCFDGMEFNAKVSNTYLRGEIVYSDGKIRAHGRGQFIARPHGLL